MTISNLNSEHDGILLLAYGGPERMEDVRPFLNNILRGVPVPKERFEAVVHHYEVIGGRSPLNELTNRQADALRALLKAEGPDLPVFVGMRFAKPFVYTAVRDMIRAGCKRVVAIILAAYRSDPSFEKYQETVQEVLDAAGPEIAPRVDWVEPWYHHRLFHEAQADQVRAAFEKIPADRRANARLYFTAHSIPIAAAERCPYVAQIETACRAVGERLGRAWSLAWQSRSGNPRTPWLEPDINEVLAKLPAEGVTDVVLCPIGFISDHVEVLYDLDLEAANTCRAVGLNMARSGAVNDHPTFIRALAELVRDRIGSAGTE